MIRTKSFDATGLAPNGRLYAGDLNAIQDAAAAEDDLTQAIRTGSLAIGEAGLQLLRYGVLEARLSGALRTDSILRALGGLFAGTFSTAQRDAIPAGSRPYGLIILNTTTNRLEWNQGTDAAPNWQPIGSVVTDINKTGNLSARPAANTVPAGTTYFATDQVVEYVSTGAQWLRKGDPAGATKMWFSTTIPAGFVLLDGGNLPSAVGIYADLYAHYGNTLVKPNMTQKVPVGRLAGDPDFGNIKATGGEKTHTLTEAELASHPHPDSLDFVDAGHRHGIPAQQAIGGPTSSGWVAGSGQQTDIGFANLVKSGGVLDAGGDQPHNNLQPFIVVNFIAKL